VLVQAEVSLKTIVISFAIKVCEETGSKWNDDHPTTTHKTRRTTKRVTDTATSTAAREAVGSIRVRIIAEYADYTDCYGSAKSKASGWSCFTLTDFRFV